MVVISFPTFSMFPILNNHYSGAGFAATKLGYMIGYFTSNDIVLTYFNYVSQATQAYLAGNKALAKDLGAKGRSANEAMKKSHASASQKIFTQRNNIDRHQVIDETQLNATYSHGHCSHVFRMQNCI